MKKIIIVILICLTSIVAKAEVYKLKSSSFAVRYNYEGVWQKWPTPTNTEVLIILNADANRVTVYSKRTQEYDIYKEYNVTYNSDGDKIWEFDCIDEEGIRCSLRMIKRYGGGFQIYMDYSDMQWMYNVYSI